ncbi:MAG: dihydroorotate dehydrogenase electron transfer subunit [Firmicutes bacterium]|nr:dihydroorotate dehydrogenase electron transfer subunit [Bacillota bacterium]
MISSRARVVEIEEVAERCFYLLLEEKTLAAKSCPGQFIHMRITDNFFPFLRRPFSIAGTFPEKGLLWIIFRLSGAGTKILSRIRRGEEIECLGPLGNGFNLRKSTGLAVLLGGGAGIAPLLFLAKTLQESQKQVALYYGASRAAELIPVQQFLPRGVEVNLATEDGSCGFKGLVTDLLESRLQKELLPGEIFACGPRKMMQSLAIICRSKKIPAQFSLEERMACGIGACQGCAVEIKAGEKRTVFKRVCRDGPVFDSCEVVW